MPPTVTHAVCLGQQLQRGMQVPVWAAALLLLGLIVIGYILWKIRNDR